MTVVRFFISLCVLLGGVMLWQIVAALPSSNSAAGVAAVGWPQSPPAPPPAVSPAPPVLERGVPDTFVAPAPTVRWASDVTDSAADRALRTARAGLAAEPHNIRALRDELNALRTLERWEDAAATLANLIELEPDDPDHAFERAGVLLRQRRWIEAAALYRTIVERQPQRSEAWFDLAVAQQSARRLNDARAAWDRVVTLRPADLRARTHRAEVLLDLHEWTAAAVDLRTVLEVRPDDADAALNLALALDRAGATAEALGVMQQGLNRRPRDVRLLNRAAELLWGLSELDPKGGSTERAAAREHWRRSLEVDASQAEVEQRLIVAEP